MHSEKKKPAISAEETHIMLRGLVARRSAAAPLRVLRRNLNLHEVSSAGHTERTPNETRKNIDRTTLERI